MKRDMDLARKLLLEIEEAPYKGKSGVFLQTMDGYTPEEIGYNIMLLNEAGLIQARSQTSLSSKTKWTVERLTWQGHEFLDAARDQNRWNQAKRTISEKGGNLTFDVLKVVLAQLARQAVGF